MKVVLAEKPSVARDLAAHLGASARHDGWLEGNGWQVTWALGHLVELKEPQDYDPSLRRWTLESLPFIPPSFGLRVISDGGARKQFGVIKQLFRGASEIICATDAGREGELIFRFILEQSGCTAKPVRRLWLGSLTDSAIRDGFKKLKPGSDYDRLHAAARCRAESDWIVGLNATRFFTVRNRAGGHLWSVGRVQTPVLAMIVERDDEIRTFKPEPYWELRTKYRETVFRFDGDRFTKEPHAQVKLALVVGAPFTILKVERKPERVLPPQLFDLTELQREMNRRYGMSAAATLKAAQELYEAKLITYPRTDSRYLTADMKPEIPGILSNLMTLRPKEIGHLDLDRLPLSSRIVDDKRVTDHHAILPSGKRPSGLAPATQKVYDAILTRLIAALYPPCDKDVTVVEAAARGVPFKARGVRVVKPGWTALYPKRTPSPGKPADEEQELPAFTPGESGPHAPWLERGDTTPPKPFNESTLLGAMETAGRRVADEELREALRARGLGTPATRAAIIETLIHRGYIQREGKSLTATGEGRYLVALIHDRALKSPEMTGEWEAKLREIEAGRLDRRRFMEEIGRYIGELIRTGGAPRIDHSRLGDCPRCGKPVIEGQRGWGCSSWREGCRFVLWKQHAGQSISPAQARELIQCGIALTPLARPTGPVLLKMLASGALTEVPVPAARPFGAPRGGKPQRPSARPGTAGPRGSAPRGSAPRAPAEPGRRRSAKPGSGRGRVVRPSSQES